MSESERDFIRHGHSGCFMCTDQIKQLLLFSGLVVALNSMKESGNYATLVARLTHCLPIAQLSWLNIRKIIICFSSLGSKYEYLKHF